MFYRIAADVVVVLHLGFIVFAVLGGLPVLKWPKLIWLHIPAAVWGALIEFAGWICPLTPLENRLRTASGEQGYAGGFVEHYLLPIIYPGGLTRDAQIVLGLVVVTLNIIIYVIVLKQWTRRKQVSR